MSLGSSPFRDLFVELPRAVFDALHAWGEAVIVKAQQPEPRRPSLFAGKCINVVLARYNWRRAETRRIEHECTTYVLAELDCGHGMMYPISDQTIALADNPYDEIKILDDAIDRTPKRCYCVQKETSVLG